jgi:hypothetical protein
MLISAWFIYTEPLIKILYEGKNKKLILVIYD